GAWTGANGGANFGFGGKYQRIGDLLQVGGLDLVQLVIATDYQSDQLAFFGAMHHQGLDGLLDRQVIALYQFGNGLGIRGIDQAHGVGGGALLLLPRDGCGLLDFGGVVGAVAEGDVVFTGLGQYVKFVGASAADGAGVGLYRTEVQAQAGEHIAVGLVHAV